MREKGWKTRTLLVKDAANIDDVINLTRHDSLQMIDYKMSCFIDNASNVVTQRRRIHDQLQRMFQIV